MKIQFKLFILQNLDLRRRYIEIDNNNNNNNDFGHTANSRCTLRKIYLNPIPFPTIVMMIIETCIKHVK